MKALEKSRALGEVVINSYKLTIFVFIVIVIVVFGRTGRTGSAFHIIDQSIILRIIILIIRFVFVIALLTHGIVLIPIRFGHFCSNIIVIVIRIF